MNGAGRSLQVPRTSPSECRALILGGDGAAGLSVFGDSLGLSALDDLVGSVVKEGLEVELDMDLLRLHHFC